jgi:acyl carrier protein
LDQFDEVEVLLEVEEEFEKIINPDEEADKIKTVKQTVEWFDKAMKEEA